MRAALLSALLMIPAALAGAALAAAATGRERVDRVPAATPTGPAVSCIPLRSIEQSQVRDDRTIDFFTRPGRTRVYRVTLPQGCPGLGFEQRFAYETSLSELCSTDIITVPHTAPIQRGASCGLAPFQPVTLAPRPGDRAGAGAAALLIASGPHP